MKKFSKFQIIFFLGILLVSRFVYFLFLPELLHFLLLLIVDFIVSLVFFVYNKSKFQKIRSKLIQLLRVYPFIILTLILIVGLSYLLGRVTNNLDLTGDMVGVYRNRIYTLIRLSLFFPFYAIVPYVLHLIKEFVWKEYFFNQLHRYISNTNFLMLISILFESFWFTLLKIEALFTIVLIIQVVATTYFYNRSKNIFITALVSLFYNCASLFCFFWSYEDNILFPYITFMSVVVFSVVFYFVVPKFKEEIISNENISN